MREIWINRNSRIWPNLKGKTKKLIFRFKKQKSKFWIFTENPDFITSLTLKIVGIIIHIYFNNACGVSATKNSDERKI